MAMNVSRNDRCFASINVTPMADVMIVLLIIFMVMTPIIGGDRVRLPPAANSRRSSEEQGALVLQLDEHGTLSIDGRDVGPFEPALGQVRELTGADPERSVWLKADREVPSAWVTTLLGACRSSQVDHIGLATDRSGGH